MKRFGAPPRAPLLPPMQQQRPVPAYLMAAIRTDVAPPLVSDVLIMSEATPTQVGMQMVWALICTQHGTSYQDASARMRSHVESSPLFAWVRPYLQRHEQCAPAGSIGWMLQRGGIR